MNAFKQQCIRLRKQDKTLNEIVAITSRSKSSVFFHVKNIPLSQSKRQEIQRAATVRARAVAAARKGKALRPFKPFTTWTSGRVLFVAHLMFDGEILNKHCVYTNRSTALTERVVTLLKDVYNFPPKIHVDAVSGVTRVSFSNVELAQFLFSSAQHLLENIQTMIPEYQIEFLRAFFDDEGCMDYRQSSNVRRIRGYQNDKTVLDIVIKLLENFGITSSYKKPNEVVITGKKNLLQFEKKINFSPDVRVNPNRTNSRWKQNLEKRELLRMAIESFNT